MAAQTNKELFTGGLAKLLKEQREVDVRLKAGSGGLRDAAISAHKIILLKLDWLDGKNLVFGEVIEGLDVVKAIEKVGSPSGRPSKPVVIVDCGQLR